MSLNDELENIRQEIENALALNQPIKLQEAQILATYSIIAIKIIKALNKDKINVLYSDISPIKAQDILKLGRLYDKELYQEILKNIFKLSNGENIDE